MNENDPFVYDDLFTITAIEKNNNSIPKKMYNRGSIMSIDECIEIEKWATDLYTNNKMKTTENNIKLRQLSKDDDLIIPLIFKIQNRIDKKEGLSSFKKEMAVNDNLIILPKNGFIHKHTDPNDLQNNLYHIRFNVFILVNQNSMNTYYDGHVVDANSGCYVLCRSGIDQHWTDRNEVDELRISLSFGYLLPAEKVDELTNNAIIGIYTQYYPLCINKLISNSALHSIINICDIEERGDPGSSIFTVANIFGDTQCDYITYFINKHSSLWKEQEVNRESGNNVKCKFLAVNELMSLNIPDIHKIDEYISKTITVILTKLTSICPTFSGNQDDGYTLRKITGGTLQHSDGINSKATGFKNYVRCLSLIIILNDDYDGGIFNFPKQNLKLKVKKGEAILFPPYWTHPHAVSSVGDGQARYAINTWILEKFI